jgi:hypothetical protein
MKNAMLIAASCAVILMAGILVSNRQASGQEGIKRGSPATSAAAGPGPGGFYPVPAPGGAPRDNELLTLLSEESKAAEGGTRLMKEYAGTDNEDMRAKIKTKLGEALGKQFDLQQKRRELELSRLEARMKKVRDLMKKRSDARTTIIEKRLDQVLREAEGLGWGAPQTPNSRRFSDEVSFSGTGAGQLRLPIWGQ